MRDLRGGSTEGIQRYHSTFLKSIVEFLRVYGYQYHEQEEKRLFSMLREKGVPAGSCPITGSARARERENWRC